jgi:hypothetical protein
MNVRLLRAVVAPAALLVLVLAACGDDATTTTADGSDGGGSVPAADGEVVVQIMVAGGFTTPAAALSTIPQLTLLSDGTVLSPGMVPLIYPGPAITPVQAGTVDEAAIDGLVDVARSLGLLDGPLDFGEPAISDAPTTTVTIVADGVTHRFEAYALAFDTEEPPGAASSIVDDGGGDGVAVDDVAAANRRALAEFVTAAEALATGDSIWEPSAIVVTVIGPWQSDPSIPAEPTIEWPLAVTPSTTGDFPCTVVEGTGVGSLSSALGAATEASGWVIGGETYSLAFRPLLPGDPGCS